MLHRTALALIGFSLGAAVVLLCRLGGGASTSTSRPTAKTAATRASAPDQRVDRAPSRMRASVPPLDQDDALEEGRMALDRSIDAALAKTFGKMAWCGTGRVGLGVADGAAGGIAGDVLPDAAGRGSMQGGDLAWNQLQSALKRESLTSRRRALVRAFLVEEAKRDPPVSLEEVADTVDALIVRESSSVLRDRLSRASRLLRAGLPFEKAFDEPLPEPAPEESSSDEPASEDAPR